MERKKLIEALNVIANHCREYKDDCSECSFFCEGGCLFDSHSPCDLRADESGIYTFSIGWRDDAE